MCFWKGGDEIDGLIPPMQCQLIWTDSFSIIKKKAKKEKSISLRHGKSKGDLAVTKSVNYLDVSITDFVGSTIRGEWGRKKWETFVNSW